MSKMTKALSQQAFDLRQAGFSSNSEVLAALQQEPALLLNHVGIDKRALEKIIAWAQLQA